MRSLSFSFPFVAASLLLTLFAGAAEAGDDHWGCGPSHWSTNETPFFNVPPAVNLWFGGYCFGASVTVPDRCGYVIDVHDVNSHFFFLGPDCQTGFLLECDDPVLRCP